MVTRLLRVNAKHTIDQLVAEVRGRGGSTPQLFPPSYAVAILPDETPLAAGEPVDPAHLTESDDATERTAALTMARLDERRANPGAPQPSVSWDVANKKPPMFQHVTPLPLDAPLLANDLSPAKSTGTPTSRFLIGRVAVALVIVNRKRGTAANPPAEFLSRGDRDLAAVEAAEGLGWLATVEPRAGVEFVFERHDVEIQVVPSSGTPDTFEDLESVWRDPALARLNLPAGRDGYARLARDVRDRHNARWGFVLFVTRYPVHHFAYASVERLVQDFDNDGWGTGKLNQVIAHETCHIFGALDEYGASHCECTSTGGELNVPNGNCRACADGFVDCIMEGNALTMCDFTRGQLGWRDPLLGQ